MEEAVAPCRKAAKKMACTRSFVFFALALVLCWSAGIAHARDYTVASFGSEAVASGHIAIFQDFLTAEVGSGMDPPATFSVIPVSDEGETGLFHSVNMV
eukprot:1724945-Rhodomonas_salina.1